MSKAEELDNKKMWESILRQMVESQDYVLDKPKIIRALKDQGFEYNDGEVVRINPKPKYYKCIKEYKGFTVGKVYKTNENGDLPSDPGTPFVIWIENPYFKEYFRPATEEEIAALENSEKNNSELTEFETKVKELMELSKEALVVLILHRPKY